MSMNFSEFKKRLGAEPRSGDPELSAARTSAPEFEAVARAADRLEDKLQRAADLPMPEGLLDEILSIPESNGKNVPRRMRWPMALAASVLVAVGAAGMIWKMTPSWATVEEYVVDHYRHDGAKVIARADHAELEEVQAVLGAFDVEATPALAEIVGLIKYCPTPEGKGVHMVLNTQSGPVTLIYMPDTPVTDREQLTFDGNEALLVELESGSAAIIGSGEQNVGQYYATVHNSIVPVPGST